MRCVVALFDDPDPESALQLPEAVDSLRSRLGRLSGSEPAVVYGDLSSCLAQLADILDRAVEDVVIVDGRYEGHDSPLIDVLADPRPGSAVLVGGGGDTWPGRVVGGVLVAAGSAYHHVSSPTCQRSAGVGLALRVGTEDLSAAASATRELQRTARTENWHGASVMSLLVVAMVRRQVRLHTVTVDPFVAGAADDASSRTDLAVRAAAVDEHEVRLRGAARPRDGFYSTFVVRRLSRRVTDIALRTGVKPNTVTLVSLVVAAAAAVCFANGHRPWLVAGALLLQVSLVFDCVDGEVARYTRQHSALGGWLDASTDRVKEYGIYAALAVGAAAQSHNIWLLASATLVLQVARHFVDFGFAVRQEDRHRRASTPVQAPVGLQDDPSLTVDAPHASAAGKVVSALSDRTDELPGLVWAKRVIIMPIGERWLIMSVAAALWSPRAALTALIVLGGLAAAYTTTGRVLRSHKDRRVTAEAGGVLVTLADIAALRPERQVPAVANAMGWLVPAVVRAAEYGAVVVIMATAMPGHLPWAFAYLFVLTVWHYDAVYRVRQIGRGPSLAARRATLGAVGRTIVLTITAVVGGPLLGVLALLGAVVLVCTIADSAASWRSWSLARSQRQPIPRFRVGAAA